MAFLFGTGWRPLWHGVPDELLKKSESPVASASWKTRFDGERISAPCRSASRSSLTILIVDHASKRSAELTPSVDMDRPVYEFYMKSMKQGLHGRVAPSWCILAPCHRDSTGGRTGGGNPRTRKRITTGTESDQPPCVPDEDETSISSQTGGLSCEAKRRR